MVLAKSFSTMEITANSLLSSANELHARSSMAGPSTTERPPVYKAVGISLAIASGLFIGSSFVLKKVGLLKANVKYSEEAGEGYGYLKNWYWWTGMTLMIIGEICNFVAYAFVDAILVTPLGALSVVITTILSAIFLKERLSFVGKVGCFMCIIGSVVIVMNAPSQSSAATIQEMKHFVVAPGFLTYAGLVILGCTFLAFWAAPRYGKKSMLVYLSICSFIGGLSVVATQGLGAAVVAQAGGKAQFNQWFLYVLLVFVVTTLVTEIIFLNKALNLFNAALVTPTYYVMFTSATIVTSAILFRGFKGTPTSIITVVMGFLQICAGVILLQLSKSAKDVPDAAVFSGDLDQVRTVAEQEEPESEPKADAIRGAAAIIRRLSSSRQKVEAAEAKRIHEEKLKDQMEPIVENEQVEWDGLRRRKTTFSGGSGIERRKTLHPPLGMAHFPDEEDESHWPHPNDTDVHGGFHSGLMQSIRKRAQSTFSRGQASNPATRSNDELSPPTIIPLPAYKGGHQSPATPPPSSDAAETGHVFGLPQTLHQNSGGRSTDGKYMTAYEPGATPSIPPQNPELEDSSLGSTLRPTPTPGTAKRQFSFQNVFHRNRSDTAESSVSQRPASRLGLGSRQGSSHRKSGSIAKAATEEEQLGLVKGDSISDRYPSLPEYTSDDEYWQMTPRKPSNKSVPSIMDEKELEASAGNNNDINIASGVLSPQPPRHGDRDYANMPSCGSQQQGDDGRATPRNPKEWEGNGGGGGGGGAFI